MEDVRIYDFEFNLLHIEHDIRSCNWTIYENDIGTFEMHFPLRSELTKVAMNNRYLVAIQGRKQAIITGKQLTSEGVLYGRTCNWILSRFVLRDFFDADSLVSDGETADKNAQALCQYIIRRGMNELMECADNKTAEFDEVDIENKTVTPIFNLIKECAEKSSAGHEVIFDIKNKRWVFRMTKGRELRSVLSEGNRNVYETEHTEDIQEEFAGGWYRQDTSSAEEWDASANSPALTNNNADNYAKAYRVTVAGSRFGIYFAEGDYIVCDNKEGSWSRLKSTDEFFVHISPNKTGIYAWETVVSGSNMDEAKKYLEEVKSKKESKAKTKGLIYGKDYFLGDAIRLEIEKGGFKISVKRKIKGVNLWYEENDVGEQPIMEEVEDELRI